MNLHLVVQKGNVLTEPVTLQTGVSGRQWKGCRGMTTLTVLKKAAVRAMCCRKDRKLVGKCLNVCRTDLDCLKGENGLLYPNGGHGTSLSSSPGKWQLVSAVESPVSCRGIATACSHSAEACCSSVYGLFFQGKDDGEN